jgi:hypothetical protein
VSTKIWTHNEDGSFRREDAPFSILQITNDDLKRNRNIHPMALVIKVMLPHALNPTRKYINPGKAALHDAKGWIDSV